MAGNELEVTVTSTVTGEAVKVKAHIDSNDLVIVDAPPPGSFGLDPRKQLPEFQYVLRILGDVAAKRQQGGQS